MTNVLVVSESFWPEGGGGTLATYLITKLLANEADLNLTVLTGTRNPARVHNIRFIVDPVLKPSNKLRSLRMLPLAQIEGHYKKLFRSFDIIYIPYGYPLIPLAKKLSKKVVVHLHDYQSISYNSIFSSEQLGGFLNEIKSEVRFEILEHGDIKRSFVGSLLVPVAKAYRSWISMADVAICVSKKQAAIISRLAPNLASRLEVIYNPLPDVPPIEKNLKEQTFAYIGGDSYVKGFYSVLRASQELLMKGFAPKFIVTQHFRNASKLLMGRLNDKYKGVFSLVGRIEHEDVLRLYSKCWGLLFPSLWEEPLPYAVLEAMLCGTIPLGSRVGGVPEIVDGTYAEKMLFAYGDADEMVDRIENVLSLSAEQLINIGSNLRGTILNRFSKALCRKQLLRVLEP
jgi:glycosyltransferase involved in cell wall biosynthesis